MLLSGQVAHRTNSSKLFWNRLFQKKKRDRVMGAGGGGEDTPFLKKVLELFGFFFVPSGNFK